MESDRKSILKEGYMKIFALSILLLIVGIILVAIGSIWSIIIDEKIDTPWESEAYGDTMMIFATLTTLFLQLGFVIFSFSTFMGALVDKTLSGEVRRGMLFASGFGILALSLMTISIIVI